MDKILEKIVSVWLTGVEQSEKTTGSLRDGVRTAGQFLWKEARLGPSGDIKGLKVGELTDDERKLIRKEFDDLMNKLRGFDFHSPVKVVRIPQDKVYVQHIQKWLGNWFTGTGLTAEDAGIFQWERKRELFEPKGAFDVLEGRSAAVNDTWTGDKLFKMDEVLKKWVQLEKWAEQHNVRLNQKHYEFAKKRTGRLARGGGTQYYVPNPNWMAYLNKGPDSHELEELT